MRAAQMKDYGGPEVMEVVDIAKPQPGEGQVLVEVHAASINPFDIKIRSGMMKEMIPLELPITMGGDIAGIVVAVGPGVAHIAEGDKVYGQAIVVAGNSGAFAEYAATKAGQVAAMPTNCDFVQAAALPLVGVSAVQAITEHLQLAPGQKIFIHGASGGIGSVAVQIAKHVGAYVAATVRGSEAADFVRSLGADEIIDTNTSDPLQTAHDFDALYDLVGGEDFARLFAVLKPQANAVSMVAQGYEVAAESAHITARTQSTKVTTERLTVLRELVEAGAVTPKVDKTFSLEAIVEAFQYQESGGAKGKVVLTIAE